MKLINRLSIALSLVMLCLVASNIMILSDMKEIIEAGSSVQEWKSVTVALFLIFIGLFSVFGLLYVVKEYQHFKNDNFMRAGIFIIGFLSLFLIAVDITMLGDIGQEYNAGHDISGEWQIVFACHFIHTLFAVILLVHSFTINRALFRNSKPVDAIKDEALFLTVNQVGIISSLLGIISFILLSVSFIPQIYKDNLLFVLSVVNLLPYGLVAAYWFFTKRKEKPIDWYDEKQFSDMSRGALFTILITVLLAVILYILTFLKLIEIIPHQFLALYLFLTLSFFSSSTLYLSKKA